MKPLQHLFLMGLICWSSAAFAEMRFIQVEAHHRDERTQIVNQGMSIEFIRSDSVWGFANENSIEQLQAQGFKVLSNLPPEIARGGHQGALDFPTKDEKFHNYNELVAALTELTTKNPDIAQLQSIGKSVENRDLWAVHINNSPEALKKGLSNKPGIIFMGAHHAREHLSVEMPLMLTEYLLNHRAEPQIANLLNTRDIWIIPMVNPDGAEYDIKDGLYRMWRKNRRQNREGNYGVDLNRNYGFKWGTGGSSKDPSSDIFMGSAPFSEPESQAIRDFVSAHSNTTVLLSFHTFSELILYPWGHTNSPIGKTRDLDVFTKMAQTMAKWNHYTPQQSSELYIASGDTTDWAYGEKGIFAFTFELSPSDMMGGGFYPGAKMIDKAWADNLKPCLYLIETAGNPYQVLDQSPSPWLKNYIDPGLTPKLVQELNPIAAYSFGD